MNTNIKSINRIQWLFVLIIALLVSGCNKDGDETIVIQDGIPNVASLLKGKWHPVKKQRADRNNPENVKDEPVTSEDFDWEFFEDGTCSPSNDPGKHYKWNSGTEGDNTSIDINGVRWYITTLSKGWFIIYRFYGDYLIIYYYQRIGAFEGDDEAEGDTGNGTIVTKITESIQYASTNKPVETTYQFQYNANGKIKNFTVTYNNKTTEYAYEYNQEEAIVFKNGALLETAYFGRNDTYANSIQSAGSKYYKLDYNSNGYLTNWNDQYKFTYSNGNRMDYISGGTYQYSNEKNDVNIDLNAYILKIGFTETLNEKIPVYTQFGFIGKKSTNLLSKESREGYDMDYVHTYTKDKQNRISQIQTKAIGKYQGETLNTTTYTIYYK